MNFYGLIIGIAIVIAVEYFEKHQKILTTYQKNILIIGTVISGIITARAYHVIDNWSFYSQNQFQIIETWKGGLGIFGGIIGGVLFILLFGLISKKNILLLLDSITPILPLSQAIGRLGNYVNQENPMWWFEFLFCSILFLIIKKYPQNPTSKYLFGYGIIRFVSEFFRHDTWVIGQINIGQLLSILFIILSFVIQPTKSHKN